MIRWPAPLRHGASIAVWAPSSPAPVFFPHRFDRGLRHLRHEGFAVRPLPSCGAALGVSTLEPGELADELHQALMDPACGGVMAAVGGWTLINVLPHIDWELVAFAAKPVVGYSDVTSLLNSVARRSGLVAFHGPMVLSEWGEAGGSWDFTRSEFRKAVGADGPWNRHRVGEPTVWSDETLWWDKEDSRPRAPRSVPERVRVVRGAPAEVEGPLWGGSLAVLSLVLGTPYVDQPEGSVVFIECEALAADEFAARLRQMELAGVFERAVGLVVGRIGNARSCLSGHRDFDEVLRTVVPPRLPIAAGYALGHSTPMTTLPVGGTVRLVCPAGERPRLTLIGPAG
ncbi:LD-carboxypeptidase [Streptomyces sp. NPDC088752]|uniref:LD-carboxypeptidase n=1 Tax=Streptomyces sp. NPDC088752 TaxID=3154963 RepID=UPI003442FB6E